MEKQVTVKVKVPLSTGKEAMFTLEDSEVMVDVPVSFKRPTFKLEDLENAVEKLKAS